MRELYYALERFDSYEASQTGADLQSKTEKPLLDADAHTFVRMIPETKLKKKVVYGNFSNTVYIY